MNRKLLTYFLIAGAGLLIVAGALIVILSPSGLTQPSVTPEPTHPPPPTLDVTPPPSLEELAEQYPGLASILTDPELGSVYKEFLVVYEEEGEEAALEMARERGMLTPEGDIRVTLVLDTEDHTALVEQLEGVGVTVVSAHRDRVNVAVPMTLIQTQLEAEEPGSIFEQLTELQHVIAVRLPEMRTPNASNIEGEGVEVIDANAWHEAGFTGTGLRIGVLDLGFAGYQNLLGVELPDDVPLEIFGEWYDAEEVHGTACAEIIHEVAPDAELFLAWYDGSDAALGEAVDWLRTQDVDIISHSAGSLVGPRDGSEWDAQLVDDLANQGVVWVNASGNEAESHYRGVFSDEDGDGYHEFAPGEELLALYTGPSFKIAMSWEDDWDQATQDYELFLYDGNGNELASSTDTQSGEPGQDPVEWFRYESNWETVYAAVTAYEVDQYVMLDIFANGAEVGYPVPAYSVCPPGDAIGSLTVGAVNWWSNSLAYYSSQGPTTDGRLKPDISAPTGVSNATYSEEDFHGTSASTPHVAGAAALVWQAHPHFTRQEVVDYLLTHAVDLGPSGPDTAYGYGRLQLPAPLAAPTDTPPPTLTPTSAPGPTITATPRGATPTPSDTPTPPPTLTAVAYITPTPVPPSTPPTGMLGLTELGLLVGGLGCAGVGLLLVGGVGMLILTRGPQRPPSSGPSPEPYQPPPPMPSHPSEPYRPPSPPPSPEKRCDVCGATVRTQARFCPVCGSRLGARYCKHCGAQLRPGAKFCPKCGQSANG